MSDALLYAQLQPFTLAGSGSSLGDTTLTIQVFNSIDGVPLTMSDFGTIGFGTVQPNSLGYEEQISWSGVTQNVDGTATLTGVKNVMFLSPYTQTSGMKVSHPGGATFVVSNTSGFYDRLTSKDDDETVNGVWTFTQSPIVPDPTTNMQAANKEYVDSIVIAGAPNASSTTKGITKLSIDPVVPTNPIAVGDNDTSATGSGSKVVRGTAGKIDMTWISGGTANGVATLDGSSLVVQNPSNAQTTAAASKIPLSGVGGKLDQGWLNITDAQVTSLTGGITSPLTTLHAHATSHVVASYLLNSASGSVSYAHGLGVTPNWVRATAFGPNGAYTTMSVGTYIRALGTTATVATNGNATSNTDTTYLVILEESTGSQNGAVSGLNATNLTIAWTKGAFPVGTGYILFEFGV